MSSAAGNHAEADFEWQEIMAIDADIEPVMWCIRHLRDVFCSVQGRSAADVSKQLDVRLQAVIVTLQTMLRKHPSLYTIDIVSALKDLQLKTRNSGQSESMSQNKVSDDSSTDETLLNSIDKLSDACFMSLSDYSSGAGYPALEKSESFENLSSADFDEEHTFAEQKIELRRVSRTVLPSLDEAGDSHSSNLSVGKALDQAYRWLEYSERFAVYVEERSRCVAEFAESLLKLSDIMSAWLPQSPGGLNEHHYSAVIKQDTVNCKLCLAMYQRLQSTQSLRCLSEHTGYVRTECDRITADWRSHCDKTGLSLQGRCEEHADTTEAKLSADLQRVITDSRTMFTTVMSGYLQLMDTLTAGRPSLLKSSSAADWSVYRQPSVSWSVGLPHTPCDSQRRFLFASEQLLTNKEDDTHVTNDDTHVTIADSDRQMSAVTGVSKSTVLSTVTETTTDEETVVDIQEHSERQTRLDDSGTSIVTDVTKTSMPTSDKKGETLQGSCFMDTLTGGLKMSRCALTHKFKKILTLSRCRSCDSYIYMNGGLQCCWCGISCHKKCLANLQLKCGKPPNFLHSAAPPDSDVPRSLLCTVVQCIGEINERGLNVKGIYRVSAVKSVVDAVCRQFDARDNVIDLSSYSPHVITGVLKRTLRQLPDALLTSRLYTDFIDVVKSENSVSTEETVRQLQKIVSRLPLTNFVAAAQLMKHLHCVADNSDINYMTAANLALVFGPTLMKLNNDESGSSSSVLLEAGHRSRLVELLILHVQQVFERDNVNVIGQTRQRTTQSSADVTNQFSQQTSDNVAEHRAEESVDEAGTRSPDVDKVGEEDRSSSAQTVSSLTRISPLTRQPVLSHHQRRHVVAKTVSLPLNTVTEPDSHDHDQRPTPTHGDTKTSAFDTHGDSDAEDDALWVDNALHVGSENVEAETIFIPGRLLGTSDSFCVKSVRECESRDQVPVEDRSVPRDHRPDALCSDDDTPSMHLLAYDEQKPVTSSSPDVMTSSSAVFVRETRRRRRRNVRRPIINHDSE